jgi:transcriptional regulator with XRE-family HTH domain
MPNIGSVLKQEIARLSRRALRGEMQATKKASTQYRHHIAALRRQLSALERQVATLQRRVGTGQRAQAAVAGDDDGRKLRFSAARLRTQRTRHGATAGDYAKLLGVSEQTVYNWEHGTHRPGQDRLAIIAELRGLGKRAVQARLEEMDGNPSSTKTVSRGAAGNAKSTRRASKKRAAKKSTRKSPAGKVARKERAAKASTRRKPAAKKSAPRKAGAKRPAAKRSALARSPRRRVRRSAAEQPAPEVAPTSA